LESGADKVSVNTAAVMDPSLLTTLSRKYGSQCVVLAIDAKQNGDEKKWSVMTRSGSSDSRLDVVEWAKQGVALGAGEILLTSLDR
jgi:cyclase